MKARMDVSPANRMGYEVVDLMVKAVNDELARCVEAATTDETKRLKSVAKSMIERSIGDAKIIMRKHVELWMEEEKRAVAGALRTLEQQKDDFSALNDQAKLVRFAVSEFTTLSLSPDENDRTGIAQYNRSLGLVMSAALGLKIVGSQSDGAESKR